MRDEVKTLDRGLRVLTEMAQAREPLGARELSRRLGIDRSTVQRCLATFKTHGFVRQDARSRRYELGYAARALAASIAMKEQLVPASEQPMRKLAAFAHETVCLNLRDDRWRVLLFQVECDEPLRYALRLGERYSLFSGAASKVLLAFLPEDELEHLRPGIEAEWQRLTPSTPNWRELEQALVKVRRDGFAVTSGETVRGVAGIAAPVFDGSGQPVASVGIYGPQIRLTTDRIKSLVPHVVETAYEISKALGAGTRRLKRIA
jgi:DNA-binding IclR family transcriptional regulator